MNHLHKRILLNCYSTKHFCIPRTYNEAMLYVVALVLKRWWLGFKKGNRAQWYEYRITYSIKAPTFTYERNARVVKWPYKKRTCSKIESKMALQVYTSGVDDGNLPVPFGPLSYQLPLQDHRWDEQASKGSFSHHRMKLKLFLSFHAKTGWGHTFAFTTPREIKSSLLSLFPKDCSITYIHTYEIFSPYATGYFTTSQKPRQYATIEVKQGSHQFCTGNTVTVQWFLKLLNALRE